MTEIAILNNMSELGMPAAERQFGEIFTGLPLRWFSLRPRDGYEPVETLLKLSHVGGLILTGLEPSAASLAEEPIFPMLARVIDWAADHSDSTVFSCLAAHVAAFHLDHISRVALPNKLSGLFRSWKLNNHALLRDFAPVWVAPHSRFNTLHASDLQYAGYRVLADSEHAGPDIIVKECGQSLFVLLQSHLEYDARSLMREYRRDILRFLTGERASYPEVPIDYFDDLTVEGFEALRHRALRNPHPDIMIEIQTLIGNANLTCPWKINARRFYENWLALLAPASSRNSTLQAVH
jgi:homoserine O-succinyltransferase